MRRTWRLWPVWVVVGVVLAVLAACSSPTDPTRADVSIDELSTSAYFGSRSRLRVDCPDGSRVLAREIRGRTWDGAQYLIYVPAGWSRGSRDLVLYAHGFIDPSQPVGFPTTLPDDIIQTRDVLVCNGFALAASSYSANGYAVAEGVRDTHLLNPIFWLRVGIPRHTYLFGVSLGGLIVDQLAETFPWRYDGAMPMCGPVGGSLLEFDYVANVRMFFGLLYPGVLDGSVTTPAPPPPATTDWRADVTNAVNEHPERLHVLASLFVKVPDPLDPGSYAHVPILQVERDSLLQPDQTEELPALLAALRYHVEGGLDAVERVHGSNPFDNHTTVYEQLGTGGFEVIDSIAGQPIPRFEAGLMAKIYYTLHYQPNGNLRIPMLTLHNLVDPDVPYFHEAAYAALALSSGYLLPVAVPPGIPLPGVEYPTFGHCDVPVEGAAAAFGILVSHVEAGLGPWSLPAPTTLDQLLTAPEAPR